MQAVGELAAGVAHDFNNLLTAILGAANDLDFHTEAAGQEDLAQIKTSARRGAALVRQLLAFGGQQTLQPRVVALNEAVQGVASLLRRLVGPGITLTLALEEPGRMVRLDPTQLDQVLVNLAVNARDAMPDGGTLLITTGHRLVLAKEGDGADRIPPGRYATLEVRDSGGGIPAEILPRIFEPFFSTKRASGGTGLGLATVHGIVRQSGGHLSVQSTQGIGTSFCITLPRHEAAAPVSAASRQAGPRPARSAGRRLLLVEDEAPVRRLAARALRRAGWEVIEAACGTDALEAAPERVTLLVSDVVMPGLDGPGLVRALREKQPGLPAILISGYADATQRETLAADDIGFLAKPFGMGELVAFASRYLGDADPQGDGAAPMPLRPVKEAPLQG
jgi:two-component system, cell cycle sensor histidine kinase and response regulator CckA